MKKIVILLIAAGIAACGPLKDAGVMNAPYPSVRPLSLPPASPVVRQPGSLYSEIESRAALVTDSRAFRMNDIVIVNIIESTTATNSATTDLERTHTNNVRLPSILGLERGIDTIFQQGSTDGTALGISSEKEHEGRGSTQRSGVFTGSLAARVIQVLPNDYLIIEGYKAVQVNGENTRMYLSGMVNPLMINKNHTVSTTQIADLHIRYGGQGVVNGQQNPGWAARILDFLWPF